MADDDIADIYRELDMELDSHRKMSANFQLFCEESIGNLAALKLLNDSEVEEAVKNS
jgi:hypothetical protein